MKNLVIFWGTTYVLLSKIHNQNTRNAHNVFQTPIHRTKMYNNSFLVRSIKLYNENVELFKISLNVKSFKTGFNYVLLKKYDE